MDILKKVVELGPMDSTLKVNDEAIMGADTDSPVRVVITRIGFRNYLACVKEVKSGQGWTVSASCLTPVE